MTREAAAHDGWYFLTKYSPTLGEWCSYAKREPFVADGDIIAEPGDMWFEFGKTEEEAMQRLMADIRKHMH